MSSKNVPVKVLHMTMLGAGGISTLIVNINKAIDLSKVTFDYLVFRNQKEFYEDDIIKLGGKKVIADTSSARNKAITYFLKYTKTKKILKDNHYDVVHVDASTPLDMVIGLAAKNAGVKCVIMHSHNAGDIEKSLIKKLIINLCKKLIPYVFTDYMATSVEAAEFMFPPKVTQKRKYTIISNGIFAHKYEYSEQKRNLVRKELGINDEFILGHIGRFSPQKNHVFILDVFMEIKKILDSSKLVLVGKGELEEAIRSKAEKLGIEKDIVFYGLSNDIPSILSSFDAFIFPSLWEGLGIAGIEAQCSGLRTYCSINIPDEASITDLYIRVESNDPQSWAQMIVSDYNKKEERHNWIENVIMSGFDIKKTADDLQSFYLSKAIN